MSGKVIPYRYYYHAASGRSFSLFTAWKPEGCELVTKGFTIAWPDGTQGTGRVPFETEAEAEAFIARNPRFKGMHGLGS
jgi:hypothetical protein